MTEHKLPNPMPKPMPRPKHDGGLSAVQGTPEWLAERAGHLTASAVKDAMAKVKTGEAAGRRNLRLKLATERLTGLPSPDIYKNAAMIWGTEHEAEARRAYEVLTGEIVEEVGFCRHPTTKWLGASPDGLIGTEGMAEIKCPLSTTHLEYIEQDVVPAAYKQQMTLQMLVCNRLWVDFFSYDPRFPKHLQLFIKRYEYDIYLGKEVMADSLVFLKEVEAMVERLSK